MSHEEKNTQTPQGENEEVQNWDTGKLSEEASQKDADEIQRQTLRGDESKGNPDNRDHAGSADSKDTPQGREEAKNDAGGKANVNG
jgi:hypothetical protein